MGLLSTIGGLAGNYFLPGIGGVIGAGLGGAIEGSQAVGEASQAQQQSSQASIAEQRRQFDALRQGLDPYAQAGTKAVGQYEPFIRGGIDAYQQQLALSGALGPQAQQQVITQIEQSPQMQSMVQQGENAMLQNASATGGLRGGNLQAAMAQFRPELLSKLIAQKTAEYGGIANTGFTGIQNVSQLGQASAAGVGAAGMNMASNIGNLQSQIGASQAGGILGQQRALTGGVTGAFGSMAGYNPSTFLSTLPTAFNYGTIPGSQQSQMLAAQERGF